MNEWLVKVRHYRGGTSVVAIYDNEADAIWTAGHYNRRYQSNNYYVERYEENYRG